MKFKRYDSFTGRHNFTTQTNSLPNRSIPSKQNPSIVCLEAKEYSCRQSILATTILMSVLLPRQYFKNSKIMLL